ncbi:MAG TPA: phage tail protein I [Chloroflexi bacterium]|nr:phage tail protein I [Chloroflexota bacterium]
MNGNGAVNFFYLNRDNRWLDFHWVGLELDKDGTLRLESLPLLEGDLPQGLEELPAPAGPAGIAVGPDGAIYFSDPAGHRVLRVDRCDQSLAPVPCLGGEGERPAQFREPRGMLFHPLRRTLFVADSGNHRIQIFDPDSWQLVGIWGQPDPAGQPRPGSEPGRLNTPWSLAGDSMGNVYVVDSGNRRVQKFDRGGRVVSSFWENMHREAGLSQPSEVAVGVHGDAAEIYVFDRGLRTVFIFDADGHQLRSIRVANLAQPMGLAVGKHGLYIGDNTRRLLLKYKRALSFPEDRWFVGEAHRYEGPVAALALDGGGGLLVHTGTGRIPIRLALRGAYARKGLLWARQPVCNKSTHLEQWHRLEASLAPLSSGAHFHLFVHTAQNAADTPDSPAITGSFADPRWSQPPLPADVTEGLIPGAPQDYAWTGAEFSSEGLASPVLSQIRIDFDHQTYLQYLPAIYQEDAGARHFLARFLTLFESLFDDVETRIDDLARLFDPEAAPAAFLAWLAGWLALDVREEWDEAQKRQAIATAFAMYARRGTAEGLRMAVRRFVGVDIHIEEPILQMAWWSLPPDEGASALDAQNGVLGFTTMLAPVEAQGAVVGSTAVLDHSHLIRQEEFGAPLFEDTAHQFSVQLYRGPSYSEQKRNEVQALLIREKPAHTTYHLCIVEPHMRVGFQARIGVDSIVAGPPPATTLGQVPSFGPALVLGGEPAGQIGGLSQVGRTTRLGIGTVEG